MEVESCVFLGVKVKPGPIERFKVENFPLDNTVGHLKTEAEKKTNLPSIALELIHHGKILKDGTTLKASGIKSGEMVHVVKKKVVPPPKTPQNFTDAELQNIVTALRSFGCTPNAPGWTRAMQMLNDEATMAEITEAVPSLSEDCVTLSMLHEVELLAALGANVHTMRRGATASPDLPIALRHLIRLVRSWSNTATTSTENVPTSGFAYSLEALSEDEDAEEEEGDDAEGSGITQEQLAAALRAATEAVSSSSGSRGSGGGAGGAGGGTGGVGAAIGGVLRLLQASRESAAAAESTAPPIGSTIRPMITPEMFSAAITEAINRAGSRQPDTPMEQSAAASSTHSPAETSPVGGAPAGAVGAGTDAVGGAGEAEGGRGGQYAAQLQHMHEMGLMDDAVNMRALVICSGDVNLAINLVFSGAIADD